MSDDKSIEQEGSEKKEKKEKREKKGGKGKVGSGKKKTKTASKKRKVSKLSKKAMMMDTPYDDQEEVNERKEKREKKGRKGKVDSGKKIVYSRKGKGLFKNAVVPIVAAFVILVISIVWFQSQKVSNPEVEESNEFQSEISGEVSDLKQKFEDFLAEYKENSDDDTEEDQAYVEYKNGLLGISFKYPPALGEVREEIIDTDPTEDGVDNKLTLTFSANPDIWIVASSEEAENTPGVYNGTAEDITELCSEPLDVSESGYCDLVGLGGVQTVMIVEPVGEEVLLNVIKSVPLNINKKNYTGLSINVGLGMPPVVSRSIFAPTDEEAIGSALLDFYRNLVKKENISLVVQDNLDAYRVILGTFEY